MANRIDIEKLIGKKFNYLTLIKEVEPHVTKGGHIHRKCLFICSCGLKKEIQMSGVFNGKVVSCGCFSRRQMSKRMAIINKKHGFYGTSEYNAWCSLKKRCLNENHKSYKDYGARGIQVDKSWIDSFTNFINDMGFKPGINFSLERIDNHKGYNKENCRWASKKEQARNQRSNLIIQANGEKKCLSEWAEILGFSFNKLHYRLFESVNEYSLEQMLKENAG